MAGQTTVKGGVAERMLRTAAAASTTCVPGVLLSTCHVLIRETLTTLQSHRHHHHRQLLIRKPSHKEVRVNDVPQLFSLPCQIQAPTHTVHPLDTRLAHKGTCYITALLGEAEFSHFQNIFFILRRKNKLLLWSPKACDCEPLLFVS